MQNNLLTCPSCGYKTIEGFSYGSHGICPVCGWQDDAVQLGNPTLTYGANKISLYASQRRFTKENPDITEWDYDLSWRPLLYKEATVFEIQLKKSDVIPNKGISHPDKVYWQVQHKMARRRKKTRKPILEQIFTRPVSAKVLTEAEANTMAISEIKTHRQKR
jgi:hypothetical protein